ncbi:hypothetical protein SAMN04488074_101188 [Lentzea albidocapillata subsp. violacea]|uniref:Uncharacterized protein n=1 Tax=Lentzea albidocapillata subsp. violacea TaxID=128104 RepID=A0A1G8PYV7_9PSEU|nr:hypothetical protein SAMN04488074_101188 [Lentzea albidocapillata subsp. violacea]
MGQLQSAHVQFAHESAHPSHAHWAWLQVGQSHSEQSHCAHESVQWAHLHLSHSS